MPMGPDQFGGRRTAAQKIAKTGLKLGCREDGATGSEAPSAVQRVLIQVGGSGDQPYQMPRQASEAVHDRHVRMVPPAVHPRLRNVRAIGADQGAVALVVQGELASAGALGVDHDRCRRVQDDVIDVPGAEADRGAAMAADSTDAGEVVEQVAAAGPAS
jgi:hypothetical protein